tara:strand:+ start:3768 stop:4313 length:546 start_codon:yes stop_codon:yes gene_type:complete
MIGNKTYNNVINTLKNIGSYHYNITTTTTGDIHDIDLEKNTLFPLMHINPINVTTGRTQLNYSFQIFIMDLVSQRADWTPDQIQSAAFLNNEQEVLSGTLQTSIDIISIFRNSVEQSTFNINDINDPVYFAEQEFTIEPFTERFDNLLTGWVFTLEVQVYNDFQTCEIPVPKTEGGNGLGE